VGGSAGAQKRNLGAFDRRGGGGAAHLAGSCRVTAWHQAILDHGMEVGRGGASPRNQAPFGGPAQLPAAGGDALNQTSQLESALNWAGKRPQALWPLQVPHAGEHVHFGSPHPSPSPAKSALANQQPRQPPSRYTLLEPAAQQSPARPAPLAMSYRGRSRSRSRSRERGRSREDRGGERVSVLVRNLPLDAR